VFEAPGGHEIIGVVRRLPLIEFDDALHAVFVPVAFRHDWMRRQAQAVRLEHDVLRDPPRGVEILFQR